MGLLSRSRNTDERRALPPGDGTLAQAGDLLALEALDRTGLAVTSEGAFLRYIQVTPPNPFIMSQDEQIRAAASYCQSVSRLRPEQSVQFYLDARPVDLEQVLAASRTEVAHFAGEPPTRDSTPDTPLALDRWRLYAGMEDSLRLHADHQAAMQLNCYIVVPFVPNQDSATALFKELRPGGSKLPQSEMEREARAHARAARESFALTESLRSDMDAMNLPTKLLNGEEVAALLWSRFNPTAADAGRRRSPRTVEVLGELDRETDLDEARNAALKLKGAIAQSAIDFKSSRHHAEVERDLEQTIFVETTADATYMGWLRNAMLTRQPFTMSVYVHALDRRRERTRVKMGYRRRFSINRGAEARGRVPDFEGYQQEGEYQDLLQEMAGHQRANVFRVSVYMSLRASGPEPDASSLAEAVDHCAAEIEGASDVKVNRGDWSQERLWVSSLPLARDVADTGRRYATRNVGDTVPLVGLSCGSARGVPFVFSEPGRTLELLNPYDRSHSNHMLLVSGIQGSGKTLAANVIFARCLAHGAKGFILDRAGHYLTLTNLVEGSRQISIGSDDSDYAINPWDVDDPAVVPGEKVTFLVSLHGVMMGDEGLTVLERAQIASAIRAVYQRCAVDGLVPTESLLVEELLRRSQEERLEAGDPTISRTLRSLAERLGEFCGEGSYAYLLDRPTNVDVNSPLIVFDTRRCPEVVLKPVMFSIIEFITKNIERYRDANKDLASGPSAPMFAGKSMLLIDEGWHMIGRKETGEYANDIARRSRHLGLFLIVMSQHLSDFDTEHGIALLNSATQKLFLTQSANEIPFVQKAMSLSDQEAAIISRLKTVKGAYSQAFWINGTRGKGQVSLRIGPIEYWAFTSDQARDEPQRAAKIKEHDGNVWAAIHDLASAGLGGAQAA